MPGETLDLHGGAESILSITTFSSGFFVRILGLEDVDVGFVVDVESRDVE